VCATSGQLETVRSGPVQLLIENPSPSGSRRVFSQIAVVAVRESRCLTPQALPFCISDRYAVQQIGRTTLSDRCVVT